MKRFTDTEKWNDPWFRKLPVRLKSFWQYVCDRCDHSGVIPLDLELASFQIGETISASDLGYLGDRFREIESGKFMVVKFIQFQYGKLSRECKPHTPVFAALERHGINPDSVMQNERFTNVVDAYIRERVMARDGLICAYTKKILKPEEVVIDHIIPKSKGGTNELNNLVVCSVDANSNKSDMDLESYCLKFSLVYSEVLETLSKRTGKAIKDYPLAFQRLQDKEQDKDKEKVQAKDEEKDSYHKDTRIVIHLLNESTGKHFREVDANLSVISARLREAGVSLDGVKEMIVRQVKRWKGTSQEDYLRPETLFGKTKFDGYYAAKNQPVNENGSTLSRPNTPINQRNVGITVGKTNYGQAFAEKRKADEQALLAGQVGEIEAGSPASSSP